MTSFSKSGLIDRLIASAFYAPILFIFEISPKKSCVNMRPMRNFIRGKSVFFLDLIVCASSRKAMIQKIRNTILMGIQVCSLVTYTSDVFTPSLLHKLYAIANQQAVASRSQKNFDDAWLVQAPERLRQELLEEACKQNNQQLILFLGKTRYVNPLFYNSQGNAPIHVAAKHGCLDAIYALKELGVSLRSRNADGLLPIHLAAQSEHARVTKQLYREDCTIEEPVSDNGDKLEHFIAGSGSIPLWQWFEKQKSSDTLINSKGSIATPIFIATLCHKEELALHLLRKYPQLKDASCDHWPLICIAIQQGLIELTKALLRLGSTFLDANPRGITAAHMAAAFGQLSLVTMAINTYKINIHHRNRQGWNMLKYAALSRNCKIFRYLIDAGADPYEGAAHVSNTNEPGSAIHIAAHAGSSEIIQWLAKKGYELDRPDHKGKKPLNYARFTQHDEEIASKLELFPEMQLTSQAYRTNKVHTAYIISDWVQKKNNSLFL